MLEAHLQLFNLASFRRIEVRGQHRDGVVSCRRPKGVAQGTERSQRIKFHCSTFPLRIVGRNACRPRIAPRRSSMPRCKSPIMSPPNPQSAIQNALINPASYHYRNTISRKKLRTCCAPIPQSPCLSKRLSVATLHGHDPTASV